MNWHNFVSAIVLGTAAMCSTGFAIEEISPANAKLTHPPAIRQ